MDIPKNRRTPPYIIDTHRLRFELARRGLDQAGFAKLAKLRPETISRAATGHPVRSATLAAIADALLGVPVRPGVDDLLIGLDMSKRPSAQALETGATQGDGHGLG
jgi:transcriptional regulator with XRE-family HTH domain